MKRTVGHSKMTCQPLAKSDFFHLSLVFGDFFITRDRLHSASTENNKWSFLLKKYVIKDQQKKNYKFYVVYLFSVQFGLFCSRFHVHSTHPKKNPSIASRNIWNAYKFCDYLIVSDFMDFYVKQIDDGQK